jgi:beta-phosphoglucomutase family hydrolase
MRLGLPDNIVACLFDLDGVLTQTAKVHEAAWKEMFDAFLHDRAASPEAPLKAPDKDPEAPLKAPDKDKGDPFRAFEPADYDRYVDGKPRFDGVRSFLESRGIHLPEGSHDDAPGAQTIGGLGNRKNQLVLALIHDNGVQPYEGSVRYVHAVIEAGLKRAVVSSSANCRDVLAAAGLADLFDTVIDGYVAEQRHLRGKPAPDTFLEAAKDLGVEPRDAAVFEDALAGVEAGRAGGFGYVVGVDRVGQADALKAHGADIVVSDLAELLEG